MGPRSDERGNRVARHVRTAGFQASMGPRSDERGNLTWPGSISTITITLQWGRAPMSAEIGICRPKGLRLSATLQWGRAPMSAEMKALLLCFYSQRCCFNGAALR